MSLNAVYLVLALIVATTLVGLLWKRRQGTAKQVSVAGQNGTPAQPSATIIQPLDVTTADSLASFGSTATLLQFSTEFCSTCPATRRMLGEIAARTDGVTHVDVDLTHRGDLANRYRILQTPTTFILDGRGALVARIGGATRRDVVERQLALVGELSVGENT
ncbi:TlpA family protein disulfide reductase [Subtercola endophyticus]|uniref:TlpA family protein disulfide reductase n=1 Tax=Subtercola endophyticus TaxID=2895559 RepID=UPI001E6110AE|nr:thioredoxin family protein [Subtercola endophyticus]UFS60144.1 thioredoxin family protein [Subtercola endophyticus]